MMMMMMVMMMTMTMTPRTSSEMNKGTRPGIRMTLVLVMAIVETMSVTMERT